MHCSALLLLLRAEQSCQLGQLRGMDDRQYLVGWLQHCIAARDEMISWPLRMMAVSTHSAGKSSSCTALPAATAAGWTRSSTKEYCPRRNFSSVIISPSDISSTIRWAIRSA